MDIASAALSLVPDVVKGVANRITKKCEIKLAPKIHPSIPYPMNGGEMQKFANLQVCFGSDTDLELVDACLCFDSKRILCESRESRLYGKDWNSFNFDASALCYVPDEMFTFKIRIADHVGHCCELVSDMQMQQFPHPKYTGVKSGRWEIQPRGIFKVKLCKRKKY